MRTTFFGLEIGKKAILTHRTSMDVTSHNIANANTDGYARQRAVLETTDPWAVPSLTSSTTAQQMGTGVDAVRIESLRDSFIDERITRETSNLEEATIASDLMKEVEAIFNEPNDATLRDQLDKFWSAWENLSVTPNDSPLRANLREETLNLIESFKDIDYRLTRLQGTPDTTYQGSIGDQLEDAVKQANNLIRQITELNVQIERVESANSQANDLRDSRQKLVEDLSELVAIDSSYDSKGHLRIRAGKETLIEHSLCHELKINSKDPALPDTVCVSDSYPEYSDDPSVASGVLSNTAALGNFTITVAETAQADKLESKLSYFPLENALSTFGVTSGNFTVNGKTFYLDSENTDVKELAAMLNSASLNVKAQVNEGGRLVLESVLTGTANAVKVSDGTSNMATVFDLQNVRAARDAEFSIGNKKYVTAENVVRNAVDGFELIISGKGVANIDARPTIRGGKIQALLQVREGNIQKIRNKLDEMAFTLVEEVNAIHRTGFDLEGTTGRNFFKNIVSNDPNRPYKDSIKQLALEDWIVQDLNTIAAAKGSLATPTDRLLTTNGEGDGSNAIAIAQVKHTRFFNDGKATIDDYYNEVVTQLATESQGFETRMTSTDDLITQLKSQRDELSGVSLDEELANLIKIQQSYNAAAKIISTMDSMIEVVVNGLVQ